MTGSHEKKYINEELDREANDKRPSLWSKLSPLEKAVAVVSGAGLTAISAIIIYAASTFAGRAPADVDPLLEKFLKNNNPKVSIQTGDYIGTDFQQNFLSLGPGQVIFEPREGTKYEAGGALVLPGRNPEAAKVFIDGKDTSFYIISDKALYFKSH